MDDIEFDLDSMDDVDADFTGNEEYIAQLTEAESRLLHLPVRALSFSQLTLHQSCPRRYYYRYVLKKRGGASAGMVAGTLTHGAVEHAVNHKIKTGKDMHPDEAFAWIDQNVVDLAAEVERWDDDAFVDITDPTKRREKLAHESRMLAGLFIRDRLPQLHPRVSEHKIETIIRDRIPYMGFVDLVVKNADTVLMSPEYAASKDPRPHPQDTILDLKTVKKNYGPHQVNNSLQLTLYAATTGCARVGFELIIRPGQTARTAAPRLRSWPEDGMGVVRTHAEIEHALDYVTDVAESIASGSYPRTTPESWVCNAKWCDYYAECRGSRANETSRIA